MDTSMATQRIIDLTAKITEGCETDYEKAKAIETYLRQYSYSTQVVRAEGDNYIDRFLFEDEVGYCTYFASSMTLMPTAQTLAMERFAVSKSIAQIFIP